MSSSERKIFGNELQSILGASNSHLDDRLVSNSDKITLDNLRQLDVSKLQPGRFQPRKVFDDSYIKELADSIREQGILQPLIVREVGGSYEIIVGERRWRAAKIIGLKLVPAIVCNVSDKTAVAYGLIENIQRKELNAIEKAQSINVLINKFSLTHEQVATAIGKSRVSVTNLIRLLSLTNEVQNMVMEGTLEMGHARALLALSSNDQITAARTVVDKKLSVRETEQLVNKLLHMVKKEVKENVDQYVAKANDWQRRLSKHLCANISVKINKEGKGRATIFFETTDEFECMVNTIEKKFILPN